ncbi:MAG: sulfotransferase family 2 domain-containing protein [Vicinamibacteraceae bacterium]
MSLPQQPDSHVATLRSDSHGDDTALVAQWLGKAKRFRNAVWPSYVFIHINKTAGSSIERALDLRFEHRTAFEKRAELGEWRWNRAFRFSFVRNPWDRVASHYFYRVKRNVTGLADNPIPFPAWVHLAYEEHDPRYFNRPRMFMPQADWLCDRDGKLLVNHVGRFESLAVDFAEVCRTLNLTATLPHLKRSANRDYRRLYDAGARSIVSQVFARDIEMFGYDF